MTQTFLLVLLLLTACSNNPTAPSKRGSIKFNRGAQVALFNEVGVTQLGPVTLSYSHGEKPGNLPLVGESSSLWKGTLLDIRGWETSPRVANDVGNRIEFALNVLASTFPTSQSIQISLLIVPDENAYEKTFWHWHGSGHAEVTLLTTESAWRESSAIDLVLHEAYHLHTSLRDNLIIDWRPDANEEEAAYTLGLCGSSIVNRRIDGVNKLIYPAREITDKKLWSKAADNHFDASTLGQIRLRRQIENAGLDDEGLISDVNQEKWHDFLIFCRAKLGSELTEKFTQPDMLPKTQPVAR